MYVYPLFVYRYFGRICTSINDGSRWVEYCSHRWASSALTAFGLTVGIKDIYIYTGKKVLYYVSIIPTLL